MPRKYTFTNPYRAAEQLANAIYIQERQPVDFIHKKSGKNYIPFAPSKPAPQRNRLIVPLAKPAGVIKNATD